MEEPLFFFLPGVKTLKQQLLRYKKAITVSFPHRGTWHSKKIFTRKKKNKSKNSIDLFLQCEGVSQVNMLFMSLLSEIPCTEALFQIQTLHIPSLGH